MSETWDEFKSKVLFCRKKSDEIELEFGQSVWVIFTEFDDTIPDLIRIWEINPFAVNLRKGANSFLRDSRSDEFFNVDLWAMFKRKKVVGK